MAAITCSTDKSLKLDPCFLSELQVWAPADAARLRQIPASQKHVKVCSSKMLAVFTPPSLWELKWNYPTKLPPMSEHWRQLLEEVGGQTGKQVGGLCKASGAYPHTPWSWGILSTKNKEAEAVSCQLTWASYVPLCLRVLSIIQANFYLLLSHRIAVRIKQVALGIMFGLVKISVSEWRDYCSLLFVENEWSGLPWWSSG